MNKKLTNIFVCKKTYTNGKDENVQVRYFSLLVAQESESGGWRIINCTSNTIWEDMFDSKEAAIERIYASPWLVLERFSIPAIKED